eukprot:scaffold6749_cov114-Isochrysis_galbana.AAC.2
MPHVIDDDSAASHPHSCEFIQSNPSRQSGMVQPVVNEMFATVHAAGSSLLGLFKKKPILAFLATGQHGAAELRVGPDGRLPRRAAVTETAA